MELLGAIKELLRTNLIWAGATCMDKLEPSIQEEFNSFFVNKKYQARIKGLVKEIKNMQNWTVELHLPELSCQLIALSTAGQYLHFCEACQRSDLVTSRLQQSCDRCQGWVCAECVANGIDCCEFANY